MCAGCGADIGDGMVVRVLGSRRRVRTRVRGADHRGGFVCVVVATETGVHGIGAGTVGFVRDRGGGDDLLARRARRECAVGGVIAGRAGVRVDSICVRLEMGAGVVVSVCVSGVHDSVELSGAVHFVSVADVCGGHFDGVVEGAGAGCVPERHGNSVAIEAVCGVGRGGSVQRDPFAGGVDGADVVVRVRDDGRGMEEMGVVFVEHSVGGARECGADHDGGVGGARIRFGLGNENLPRLFRLHRVQLGDCEHGDTGCDIKSAVWRDHASVDPRRGAASRTKTARTTSQGLARRGCSHDGAQFPVSVISCIRSRIIDGPSYVCLRAKLSRWACSDRNSDWASASGRSRTSDTHPAGD